MNNPKTGHFPPARRLGLILHTILIILLALISAWGFFNLTQAAVGPRFVSYLLIGFLAFAPIPFFAYRAYALLRADYYIDRDSLAMLWGLRVEDVPLTDIEWVRPASDLTRPLLLPRFRLPGAVLGTRRHPDLGLVEFIASSSRNIILIATSKRIFAISPQNPAALVQTFARATEMGSLMPTEAKSVYPSFLLTQAWESSVARFLWISGILLNLGLILWVGMLIPSFSKIPFGFNPFGTPNQTASSTQLILLPLISAFMFIVGIAAGLYFYRWERQRPLAFIVWLSSTLCAFLFLMAVLFLVSTPV
jgi:PH (Pleckstrin Homology) domain-containing protein